MYFIHDYSFKELIFGFNSHEEAETHFLKNSIMEKLKLYRHKLMSNTLEKDDETINSKTIVTIRDVESIMENILEIDEESEVSYIKGQLNLANAYLAETPFKLSYTINLLPENVRTYKLT